MQNAYPSDRMIRKDLFRMAPELIRRYGRTKDCTRAQVMRTITDLKTSKSVYPYLCAAFLSDGALRSIRGAMPNVNWEEVKNRATRIRDEYDSKRVPYNDCFYESGIGLAGG
jgi:hypothetical protein